VAIRQRFQIEGLKECQEALRDLKKATAKNILLRALKEVGEWIARAGEALAPRLSGLLADSYTVGTKLSRRQKKLHKKESDVEVFVGPMPHAKSVQTEFGNAHQVAHPHLRPAWDANKQRVTDGLKDRIWSQIEAAAERAARKAARLLAKMKKR